MGPPGARSVFEGAPRALGEGVGGRLRQFLPFWEEITGDKFVLSVVRGGYCIRMSGPLPHGAIRRHSPLLSPLFQEHIAAEVDLLLKKGAIERVPDHPSLCLSPVFIIPKRSGKLRMILNMKEINTFIPEERFRMETLATILPAIGPEDVAISLDLRDAYFHVPIHPTSRNFLGFSLQGETFRYRALPFGLKPAPRVFTRVVSALATHLRKQGLRLFTYLDDWLLVASSVEDLRSQTALLLDTVQRAGFIVNWEKSELSPTRTPTYLGAEIDIPNELARPSGDRIRAITKLARSLRQDRRVRAERWLRFLGHLASLVDVLQDCRLHMRPFQFHLRKFFRPTQDPRKVWVPLSPGIRLLLDPWSLESFLRQGKPLRAPSPSVTVTTDASFLGWGGHCQGQGISGDWSDLRTLPHINVLELMAVSRSLQHFQDKIAGHAVLILTDNTTVAAYINRQGGMRSSTLNGLAAKFWRWCRARNIFPVASYLPGQENLLADFLSRGMCLQSEWTLEREVFDHLRERWPRLEVDLFASSLTFRLPIYCSRVRDPNAWALDAFAISWSNLKGYAFPPVSLIPKVLRKIQEDRAWVLLIAPDWPRRPWFPLLLSLLDGPPVPLPQRRDIIAQPLSGILHQDPMTLHLTAWPLSGSTLGRQDFRNELPVS